MSDPLAVRLRSGFATQTEQAQAAALIDGLTAENAELVAALRPFAVPHPMGDAYVQFSPKLIEAARAALWE